MRGSFRSFFVFSFAFLVAASAGCSIPNLESPECTEARDAMKQFYSFHFANDMRLTAENFKLREKYLTQDLLAQFKNQPKMNVWYDYFTQSSDPPTTFKIGKCTEVDRDHTSLQVQLYWRSDQNTVQKEVEVEAVKYYDKWLLNGVR